METGELWPVPTSDGDVKSTEGVDVTEDVMGVDLVGNRRYTQLSPRWRQEEHFGICSSHFTRLFLHWLQPSRDLVCVRLVGIDDSAGVTGSQRWVVARMSVVAVTFERSDSAT